MNCDYKTAGTHLEEVYNKIRTAHRNTNDWCSSMNFCKTTWEKHFVLKLRVNRLYQDAWDVETSVYVVKLFLSEAQIEVALKITEKCRIFYHELQQKLEDDFSKVDDAKNGGRLIR